MVGMIACNLCISDTRARQFDENVFLLGGLGSRGFCYGPILGDHVASLISNNVSPLEKIIADSLEPNRFK